MGVRGFLTDILNFKSVSLLDLMGQQMEALLAMSGRVLDETRQALKRSEHFAEVAVAEEFYKSMEAFWLAHDPLSQSSYLPTTEYREVSNSLFRLRRLKLNLRYRRREDLEETLLSRPVQALRNAARSVDRFRATVSRLAPEEPYYPEFIDSLGNNLARIGKSLADDIETLTAIRDLQAWVDMANADLEANPPARAVKGETRLTVLPHYRHVAVDAEGTAYVAGTTTKVTQLVSAHLEGDPAEQLKLYFGYLSDAQIYGVLSYYYDHKDRIDAELSSVPYALRL